MRNTLKAAFYLALCFFLIACGRIAAPATPAATPARTATSSAAPAATASPTLIPYPTLIPMIEPAEIPDLLSGALSIQTLDALNGHSLRRITGWENGFGRGLWNPAGYQWMDADHLLLFPRVGQTQQPNWTTTFTRSAVIALDTGELWLPPSDQPVEENRMLLVAVPRWSRTLGVLIASEIVGEGDAASPGVSIYTPDGRRVAHYEGELVDISPSATKLLIAGDTWVDLGSGRRVDFGWGPGSGAPFERWLPIWSPDESQFYFCCFYYGNAATGESYAFTDEDTIFDGGPLTPMHILDHSWGIWLNDRYVLAKFDGFYTGIPDFIPLFDLRARTFRDLGVVTGLPAAFNNNFGATNSISPDGNFMGFTPGAQSSQDPQVYLVDLRTMESRLYPAASVDWSPNGRYAILDDQVLTLSDGSLRPLPEVPDSAALFYWIADEWHPTQGTRAVIYEDKPGHEFLYLLSVETLTYRHLPLPPIFDRIERRSTTIVWSPNGDRLALAAPDGSLWQLDFPALEHLEQLTPPMADVGDLSWSPDGASLSFVGGKDIYIVDTRGNP